MKRVLSVLVAVSLVLSLFTGVFGPVPTAEASTPYQLVLTYDGSGHVELDPTHSHGGGGSDHPDGWFHSGTQVTLTPHPDSGWHFDCWTGDLTGSANPDHVHMGSATVNVKAWFHQTTWTLTYTTDGNGTISGTTPQTVNDGANGTAVTAMPSLGFHFVNWSDGSTANPRTDTHVDADITVHAHFSDTWTLTYTAASGGWISGMTPQYVTDGADGTAVTAQASSGHVFEHWSDIRTDNPRTDSDVYADITVQAHFQHLPLGVTTNDATGVGAFTATLNGTLDGIGDYDGSEQVHVYFEYKKVGASSWIETNDDHQSSAGAFSDGITGLEPATDYEFRAVAHGHHEGGGGHQATVYGDLETFTTLSVVTTKPAAPVTATSETLNGTLDDWAGYTGTGEMHVYFEYRKLGVLSWTHTAEQDISALGAFAALVTGLDAYTEYEFMAVAHGHDEGHHCDDCDHCEDCEEDGHCDECDDCEEHCDHCDYNPEHEDTFYGATLTFWTSAKPVTVTALAATKVYGSVDPVFAYTVVPALDTGDVFTGALTHLSHVGTAPYENVGAYGITIGTLSAGSKYAITFVPAIFTVTPKPITVAATAASKIFGAVDPVFTSVVSETGITTWTGALSHDGHKRTPPYENVGTYAITLGTLSAGPNYVITFVSAAFIVAVNPMTLMPPTIDLPNFSTWPGVTGYTGGAVPNFTSGSSPFPLEFTLGDDSGSVKWTIKVNGVIVIDPVGIGLISYNLPLNEGKNDIEILAVDETGLWTSQSLTIYLDTRPPVVTLSLPSSVSSATLLVMGSAVDAGSGLALLSINGEPVVTYLDGSFSEKLTLTKGVNTILVEARDKEGNTTSQTFTVKYGVRSSTGPSSIYLVLTIGRAEMEVNGMPAALDAAPFIKDGRTLLPIRALIEVLGGSVQWNASTRTATVALGSRSVALTIGSTTALVDGKAITLDVAPMIVKGRTFLPLRAIAENLGLDLAWEPVTRTISLTYWP